MLMRRVRARLIHSAWLIAVATVSLSCSRAAVASFLPALQLGLQAQRSKGEAVQASSVDSQRWSAAVLVSLRFQPRTMAEQLPTRLDLAAESWALPCDADDLVCLQDALALEPEIAASIEDVQ